ncbi:putative ribonuclease H-like superfamily [Arabidopsis thaliana]
MNLCINCKEGTMFLSSKDCFDDSHTCEYIFAYVNEYCIKNLGGDHVVQVVTNNATNNMTAAKLLQEVRPTIFWTFCATHTINLMVEGISKLAMSDETVKMAKAFTIFIYAHHQTLSMMRSFTKRRDIVRPGITRFASAFLTLKSLVEKEENLKMMFASNQWKCKWAKHP